MWADHLDDPGVSGRAPPREVRARMAAEALGVSRVKISKELSYGAAEKRFRFDRGSPTLPTEVRMRFGSGALTGAIGACLAIAAVVASADDPVPQAAPATTDESQRPATTPQPSDSRPIYTAANTPECKSYYPMEARRAGIEGTSVLVVLVGTDGRATHVRVESSSGSKQLDVQAAACVIRQAKFKPATNQDGQPVAQWQRMTWRWKLKS